MTPAGHHGTHSASSSVSGFIHTKDRRESESEKEDVTKTSRKREAETDEDENQPKKRRIAPTPVSNDGGSA
jgi:chromatin assembly factor 1 subunit B